MVKPSRKVQPKSLAEVVQHNRSMSKTPAFQSTSFDQSICRHVLPLIVGYGSQWHVMGTCVMVAPGLALTARHVVQECLRRYCRGESSPLDDPTEVDGNFAMEAAQLGGEGAHRWGIYRIHCSKLTDVAFLQMRPFFDASKLPLPARARMSLVPPPLGSRIVAFGYPNGQVNMTADKLEVRLDPHTAVGEVVEIHQLFRDQLLAFPVFRTNARFDPGMSGGPVFDETGSLCGLICTNMPVCDGQDHVSYVTLLWPCMATRLTFPRKCNPEAVPYFAVELARDNCIVALGWECVQVINEQDICWQPGAVAGDDQNELSQQPSPLEPSLSNPICSADSSLV